MASESAVVDIDSTQTTTVTTEQPKIVGEAPANVVINIEVNSETQITQQITADANGNYELDIAELSKTLEPGEHSVTITYTDPTTGQPVTKTKTFTVAPKTTQLAQSSTAPYGSGNPYPVGGTSSATATSSATSSSSTRTTMPSTSSALPVSGSVGSTIALIIGGIFFIIAGLWSFWIASEYNQEKYLS